MKSASIIVTGGAGFIGSNLIKKLNKKGIDNIIIVDNLDKKDKWKNLRSLSFYDFIDYKTYSEETLHSINNIPIKAIFHLGANSDVLSANNSKMINLNFTHSKRWLNFALKKQIDFIFASSSATYGNSLINMDKKGPHNIYALSKLMFDNYVNKILKNNRINNKIIGLKFFNNYGWGEFHKDKNASLVYRFFKFIVNDGKIPLFNNAMSIKRDYMWVENTAKILVKILSENIESGIYDLGTGEVLSHHELALLIIKILKKHKIIDSKKPDNEYIDFIDFPKSLKGKFQFYTRANIPYWYSKEELVLPRKGIERYLQQLIKEEKSKNDN